MKQGMARVFVAGNIVDEQLETKFTKGGTPMVEFSIAVNEYNAGTKKTECSFFKVQAYGPTAENCAKYLKKGQTVIFQGSISNKTWATNEGQKRSRVVMVIERVLFGDSGYGKRQTAPSGPDGETDVLDAIIDDGEGAPPLTDSDVPF